MKIELNEKEKNCLRRALDAWCYETQSDEKIVEELYHKLKEVQK